MNLEQIQEMWEKDSHIDPDNLHDESLKIPQPFKVLYTLQYNYFVEGEGKGTI